MKGDGILFAALLEIIRKLFVFTGFVETGGFPPKLTREEEAALIKRMEEGDGEARNELIERNLRLAAHIAKKYRAPGRDTDDLISIGSLGLIKAVSTYTAGKGRSLAAYAGRCIENEILMHLRSERRRAGDISLETPIGTDRDGNEMTVADILGTDEDEVFFAASERISSEALKRAVERELDGRERAVIVLRYGLDGGEPLPQREAARLLGISRSYVSRLEKKAVERLRNALCGDEKE